MVNIGSKGDLCTLLQTSPPCQLQRGQPAPALPGAPLGVPCSSSGCSRLPAQIPPCSRAWGWGRMSCSSGALSTEGVQPPSHSQCREMRRKKRNERNLPGDQFLYLICTEWMKEEQGEGDAESWQGCTFL